MKFFFLFAAFACNQSFAQPKNTTTIVVKGISFNAVLSKLKAIDYPIEKKDVGLETASTYFMLQDRDRWSFSIQISVKDSIAYISGKLRVTAAGGSTNPSFIYEVRNKGMKGSPFKKAFTFMNDFALSLNGEISYIEK